MSDEIELKLAVAAADLARLRRNPLLRTLASGRRSRRVELESTYFDTPNLALKAQGMALRVRKQGKRRTQTLKVAKDKSLSTLREIRELEVDIAGDSPDIAAIDDADLRALLSEEAIAAHLKPVFTTRIVRHLLPLRLMDSEIEVAFDEGTVSAGEREDPVCEMELELLSGAPEYLLQLALAISEQVKIQLETRSKAARGYALAKARILPAMSAHRTELSRDATAGQAFEAIAKDCLQQMRTNEAALLSGNREPEAVHQLRVGVRRLRAALSLFRPLIASGVDVQLREDLGWLQNVLGPARDWDVFRLETLGPMTERLPETPGLTQLRTKADAVGEEAYDDAMAALRSHRYAVLLLRLELWLRNGAWCAADASDAERPVADFATEAVAKRAKQVLKRGKEQDPEVEETLHDLRIAGKKMRYALEFFRDVMKEGAREAITLSKSLQDCLGSLNDAAVSRGLLDSLQERYRKDIDGKATGLVLGWQAHRVGKDLSQLDSVWAEVRPVVKRLAAGKAPF
ncbi:MAG: inorganic triphosphatase [Rhodospirillales bacterium]